MSVQASLSASEREATRKHLRIWIDSQPLLEAQHLRELMNLTDAKALWMTKALFSRRLDYRPRRDSSGLVEQQALFQRLRGK